MAVVGQEIGAEDDATVQYILGGSPLLTQLAANPQVNRGFCLVGYEPGRAGAGA